MGMVTNKAFSWQRLLAVLTKEFIQLRRDRIVFAMILSIPLIELILFGFAINTNPKQMPTVIIANDHSEFTRALVNGLKNTDYFAINNNIENEAHARKLLATGKTQFIITIPTDFTKKLLRQEKPKILLEADATDPVTTSSAIGAANTLMHSVFQPLFRGSLQYLRAPLPQETVELVTHANYNPESITTYNIVPGLLGVILSLTLVGLTSLGITKEREDGTMEHLLSTPVKPLEVMLGKLISYIALGYIQMFLILLAAKYIFAVPCYGSIILLTIATLPFIIANLAIGLTFSSLANTQLQATQMSMFFFLPSLLLSGFMFPFHGMPPWAECIGAMLPLTYFLRIARGIILKGNGIAEVWTNLWPIVIFMVIAILIALKLYRKTLD